MGVSRNSGVHAVYDRHDLEYADSGISLVGPQEFPVYHEQLDRGGYSATVIHDLVLGNWVRKLLWTANALILLGVTAHVVFAAS